MEFYQNPGGPKSSFIGGFGNCQKTAFFERKWIPCAIIAGAALLVYFRTLFCGFTYLDDNGLILNNMAFLGRPANVLAAFSREAFNGAGGGSYYRPLLLVSLIGDACLGGSAPFFYHFTNVVLHMLVCMALYVFLRAWGRDGLFSLSAALFFAVHPALNQAVAWIPGRNDVLLALFSLLCFTSFIAFAQEREQKYLAPHLLFYACALFTKESALLLPFFLALYALAIRRDIPRTAVLRAAGGWFVITILWSLMRAAALKTVSGGARYDIARSLYENFPALLPGLGKALFPFNLSVMPVLKDMSLMPGLAALAVIIAALYKSRGLDRRRAAFAGLWFLLWLLPSFIRPSGQQPDFTEHRLYVPFIGLMMLAGEIRPPFIARGRTLALLLFALLLFAGVSVYRARYFTDRVSFWENAARTSPHSLMNRTQLGAAYYERGRYAEAGEQWSKALELAPDDPAVELNMGAIRFQEGRMEEAGGLWERALRADPGNKKTLNNLAVLYYERKDYKRTAVYVGRLLVLNSRVSPALLAATAPYLAGRKTQVTDRK